VRFAGRPLDAAARGHIGFLPESPYFYDYLTVEEALGFYADLYGLSGGSGRRRCDELLEQLHLASKRHAKLRTLSKGTLQRLGVAQAIIARPRLLILDEPMSGLDPAGRHHMRELIRSLQRDGTTVLFSSHILPDAEALCSRVGILAAASCDVVQFRSRRRSFGVSPRRAAGERRRAGRAERLAAVPPQNRGDTWHVRLPDSTAVAPRWRRFAARASVESLPPLRASLEERFAYVVMSKGSTNGTLAIARNTAPSAPQQRLYSIVAFAALVVGGGALRPASIGNQMKFEGLQPRRHLAFGVVIAVTLGVSMLSKELGRRTILNILSSRWRWQFIVGNSPA
jgi:ABC-type uncharacterized transport system ATPase subunit